MEIQTCVGDEGVYTRRPRAVADFAVEPWNTKEVHENWDGNSHTYDAYATINLIRWAMHACA